MSTSLILCGTARCIRFRIATFLVNTAKVNRGIQMKTSHSVFWICLFGPPLILRTIYAVERPSEEGMPIIFRYTGLWEGEPRSNAWQSCCSNNCWIWGGTSEIMCRSPLPAPPPPTPLAGLQSEWVQIFLFQGGTNFRGVQIKRDKYSVITSYCQPC